MVIYPNKKTECRKCNKEIHSDGAMKNKNYITTVKPAFQISRCERCHRLLINFQFKDNALDLELIILLLFKVTLIIVMKKVALMKNGMIKMTHNLSILNYVL